jgi:hypothetical protein
MLAGTLLAIHYIHHLYVFVTGDCICFPFGFLFFDAMGIYCTLGVVSCCPQAQAALAAVPLLPALLCLRDAACVRCVLCALCQLADPSRADAACVCDTDGLSLCCRRPLAWPARLRRTAQALRG